jgi:hypothetical protein
VCCQRGLYHAIPPSQGFACCADGLVVPFTETPDTVKAPGGKSGRGVSGRLARIPNLGNGVVLDGEP